MGDSLGQARTLVNLVQLHRVRREPGAAIEATTRAIQLFETVRDPVGLARARRTLGRLHVERGDTEKARAILQEAAESFGRVGAEAEARDTRNEAAAIGRRVGIPWWAWLMVGLWALVIVAIVILVALYLE